MAKYGSGRYGEGKYGSEGGAPASSSNLGVTLPQPGGGPVQAPSLPPQR